MAQTLRFVRGFDMKSVGFRRGIGLWNSRKGGDVECHKASEKCGLTRNLDALRTVRLKMHLVIRNNDLEHSWN
jgi:hypothetical protein